jgi:DNA-binding transcriptional LysR family regulator
MYFAWLTTFRKVVDERSYTRAAEALFISQSAASQQIRHLEQLFKAQLIRKQGRELLLTEAGQAVYELACSMEADFEATRKRVSDITHTADSQVTVVSTTSPLVHRMPPVTRRFWSEHPDVSIKTLLRLGRAIPDAVRSGVADIGIHTAQNLDGSLQAIPLRSDPLVVVCSSTDPLAGIEYLTAADLARERIAVLGPGSESRQLLDRWFAGRGLAVGQNVLQLAGIEEIRTAALEGIAVGVLPRYVVADELASARLVQLPVADFDLHQTPHVIFRPTINPTAYRLVEMLVDEYGVEEDALLESRAS